MIKYIRNCSESSEKHLCDGKLTHERFQLGIENERRFGQANKREKNLIGG